MMETPADKVVGYAVVSIVVALVIMVVVWMVLGSIFLVGAVTRIY